MLPPVRNLFIASEVRSGSTWVGELLAYFLEQHGRQVAFGLTHETFRDLDETSTYQDACRLFDQMWRDPTGLATAKLQCASLSLVYREAQHSPELMSRFFGPDTAWIVLRRRDTLRQAVSLSAARRSERYHHYGDTQADADLGVGHEETDDALAAILRSDLFLATFAERNPSNRLLTCDYETIRRQPEEFLRNAFKLCDWDFPQDPGPADLTKLKPWADRSKAIATEDFGQWLLCNYVRKPVEPSPLLVPTVAATPKAKEVTAKVAETSLYNRRRVAGRHMRYPRHRLFGKGAWLLRGQR